MSWQLIVNKKLSSSSAVALATPDSMECLIDALSKDKNRQEASAQRKKTGKNGNK